MNTSPVLDTEGAVEIDVRELRARSFEVFATNDESLMGFIFELEAAETLLQSRTAGLLFSERIAELKAAKKLLDEKFGFRPDPFGWIRDVEIETEDDDDLLTRVDITICLGQDMRALSLRYDIQERMASLQRELDRARFAQRELREIRNLLNEARRYLSPLAA